MQGKIKAMSAESKASAIIIGSLPVFVAGALYLTSPKYIGLLGTGCPAWQKAPALRHGHFRKFLIPDIKL